MQLAKLEKVDLRNVWKHEASNFTNWLAESGNLGLLSEEDRFCSQQASGTSQYSD